MNDSKRQHLETNHHPDVSALMLAAAELFQAGRLVEARKWILTVLVEKPLFLPAQLALGSIEAASGCFQAAEAAFRSVLTLNPTSLPALANLTALRFAQGDANGTIELAKQTLAIAPDHLQTLINLGRAANSSGRTQLAQIALERACRLHPHNGEAHAELAIALYLNGDWDSALEWARKATAQRPDLPRAWKAVAFSADRIGLVAETHAAYDRLAELTQDPLIPLQRLAIHPVVIPSTEDGHRLRGQLMRGLTDILATGLTIEDPINASGPLPFYYAYDDLSLRDETCALSDFYRHLSPNLTYTAPHCQTYAPAEGRPLRIGFVSANFGDHVVGHLYREMMSRFRNDDVSTTVLAIGITDEKWSSLASADVTVVPVAGSLRQMQQQLAQMELDALVFNDIGMEPNTYFLAHARLAPVQVMLGGHPVTSGISTVDYFISVAGFETDEADSHYSETLVQLQSLPAYFKRPPSPLPSVSRNEFGLHADDVVFTCAQTIFKLHPDFDVLVADILRKEPRGLFVLVEGTSKRWFQAWQERFARSFPELKGRTQVIPHQPYHRFLGLLQTADAVLDPIYFGGGTTAWSAFAIGVPVVTWPGRFYRGRATAGLYGRMGITEPIASDADSYVSLALRLAHDPDWKASIRQQLLERNGAILEQTGIVGEFQAFLRAAAGAASQGERITAWPAK